MITVKVKKTEHDYRIRVTGHAGFHPGNDIVCSAISVLTYMLGHALSRLAPGEYEETMQDGYAEVYISPRNKDPIFPIYDEVVSGYRAIAREYPHNVKVQG